MKGNQRSAERGCSIIGAGDDDQSIDSFRRAAPEGIRGFPDDYPGNPRESAAEAGKTFRFEDPVGTLQEPPRL